MPSPAPRSSGSRAQLPRRRTHPSPPSPTQTAAPTQKTATPPVPLVPPAQPAPAQTPPIRDPPKLEPLPSPSQQQPSPPPQQQQQQQYTPSTPSGLRESSSLSEPEPEPELNHPDRINPDLGASNLSHQDQQQQLQEEQEQEIQNPSMPDTHHSSGLLGHSYQRETCSQSDADEATSLLHHERAHDGPCNHGTFSPRATSPPLRGRHVESERASLLGSDESATLGDTAPPRAGWRKALSNMVKSKKMTTSSALAERHGFEDSWFMYLSYYIPCLIWMRQYNWTWLKGDFTAAVTMASMYLPMALSYAENLAHVSPISGLYAFVFNPFLYAVLGSCPQMIVGPEAAGSLLVGSVVKNSVDSGNGQEDDLVLQSKIAGVAVGIAGAYVFVMGLGRFGFIDNVLSRPFLRGFISSIGLVIFIDQMIPVLGLNKAAHEPSVPHRSTVEQLEFIFTHLGKWHQLSGIIGIVSFAVIMVLREIKRRLQPRYPGVAYFPDRLLVVVISAFLAYYLDWEERGVELLGKVEAASGHIFTFRNPFQLSHIPHIREAMGTSFLIGMLGFFESSVAAKSLGDTDFIEGMQLSPNRELIALGAANLIGACFMALPAFGGYGRSKLNKSTGGKSPMSSIFLSIITVICILFLLPWFYYLPKPILSALIMVVAFSLIEELPEDLVFFVRIRGWEELSLMAVIVLVTVFFSLNLGIAIGIGLSLLQVVRHATRPRIQILGRVPNSDRFANAEEHPEQVEFIEGCLIVKIPEPLTFANTGDLKSRLRRMERYGTDMAHPALPRLRPHESNRNIIFDIHGVTSMDGSGTQVLEEIVRKYREQGVKVFFSRAPSRENKVWKLLERSGIVALVGGEHLFVDDIQDALRMAESSHIDTPGEHRAGMPSAA
ncbi:sulfate transporter family-domain-containing protein [Nemania abortiva]|nr:sulfate transporter family-domain-containing protein [Nemania abortiva]